MAPSKAPNKKEGGIDLTSESTRISDSEFVGRDRIEGLSGKDVNRIIETLLKYFPKGYLQDPNELDKTLSEFRHYHERLHEYKELHNGINEILVAFEPFRTEVHHSSFNGFLPKLGNLRILWRPVSTSVGSLLKWSQTIKYIGKPFQDFEDKGKSGEDWAIQFSELRNRIDDFLSVNQYSKEQIGYPTKVYLFGFQRRKDEIRWSETLFELTSSFSHISSYFMNLADKQLRETAQELFNLSSKALVGYQLR